MSFMDQAKAEAQNQKEAAANRGEFTKLDWYKPTTGTNHVRILPHWSGDLNKLMFKKVVLHWNVEIDKTDGTGTVAIPVRCLKDFEKRCPLCEKWDAAKTKEDKAKLNSQRPVESYLYNIFDIEKKEAKPYSAPVTVHTAIFEWVEDIGANPTDWEEGRDWKLIKKVDPNKSPKNGTTYAVRVGLDPTKFPEKFREAAKEGMINFDNEYVDDHSEAIYRAAGVKKDEGGGDPTPAPKEAVKEASKAPVETKDDDPWAEKSGGPEESEDIPFKDGSEVESGGTKAEDSKEEKPELDPKDVGINLEDKDLEDELKSLGIE